MSDPLDPTPPWVPPADPVSSSDPVPSTDSISADSAAYPVVDEAAECRKEIARILTDHGNLESNIGINHPYWGLKNKLNYLNSK